MSCLVLSFLCFPASGMMYFSNHNRLQFAQARRKDYTVLLKVAACSVGLRSSWKLPEEGELDLSHLNISTEGISSWRVLLLSWGDLGVRREQRKFALCTPSSCQTIKGTRSNPMSFPEQRSYMRSVCLHAGVPDGKEWENLVSRALSVQSQASGT